MQGVWGRGCGVPLGSARLSSWAGFWIFAAWGLQSVVSLSYRLSAALRGFLLSRRLFFRENGPSSSLSSASLPPVIVLLSQTVLPMSAAWTWYCQKPPAGNWALLALAVPVLMASITKGGKINQNTPSPSPREGISHQVVTFTCCMVLAARAPRPASTAHPLGEGAGRRHRQQGGSNGSPDLQRAQHHRQLPGALPAALGFLSGACQSGGVGSRSYFGRLLAKYTRK